MKPAGEGARIEALDHLRGLSVLGILLVNAIAFAQPMAVYDHPELLSLSPADERFWWLTQVFCRDKFITAFTLLFGISAFMVGKDRKVLTRRLLWLGVFGVIHGALIWHGDVLLIYAVAGGLLMRWLDAPWRSLLVLGLALFIAGAVLVTWPDAAAVILDPERFCACARGSRSRSLAMLRCGRTTSFPDFSPICR